MPFAVASSNSAGVRSAASEAGRSVKSALGAPAELAIAFFSPHHAADVEDLAAEMRQQVDCPVVGVLGESVIAGYREWENRPAVAVWAARWGGRASIEAFHLNLEQAPDGPSLFGWPDSMVDSPPSNSLLLCFGDPYTFPAVELFLPTINDEYPGLAVAGGMASSPTGPGNPMLFLNDEVHEDGAVCVLLRNVPFRTVVSQGCRPVGKPMVITKGQENVIQELSGRTPLDYLRALLEESPEQEKGMIQRGLLIGIAIDEYRESFGRGDFLIRNLIGLDPKTGALAVTDRVRVGQTIQFQVRDADSADEDLRELVNPERIGFRPAGGLVFSCNGRGTRMFEVPDHDAATIQRTAGPLALAGFFAAGELGMVGGKNFIHGFTASCVVFE